MERAPSGFWRERPTLVTGASGLVGSWLVRRLVEARASVVALVRDWTPASELVRGGLLDRVAVVRGDVCDPALVERALGEYEIDTVVHLAAQTIVPIANRNPASTWQTNVAGTWTVLEACRRTPTVRQIVVASSDKAYGAHGEAAYAEDMSLDGTFPYDASKACADRVAQSYAASFGLPVVIARCANFFGGGDLNWSRLVPGTIRCVLRGERPVIRSDGTYVRDYLYVEDGADAYALLAERLAGDGALRGRAFNFSTGTPMRVLDLVERILALCGSELRPDVRGDATREIVHQTLDASRARSELGWSPRFTLEEGLRRTIAWYRSHLAG